MGARPYFPFYHSDYLGSTLVQELAPFEEWVYMRCLIHCGASGSIPADLRGIQAICKYQPIRQLQAAWEKIQDRFEPHPDQEGRLINRRMEQANGWIRTQRENGQRGGQRKAENRGKASSETRSEMPSEYLAKLYRNSSEPSSEVPSEHPTSISIGETPYSPPTPKASEMPSEPPSEPLPLPPKKPKLSNMPAYTESFLRFWAEYPEKTGKGAAWKSWEKLKPNEDLTLKILAAVTAQRSSRKWREGFIPNPATWLNQRRWEDEAEARPTAGSSVHDFL